MIIAYRHLDPPRPWSFIKAQTGVAITTCHNIYKHALSNARKKQEAEADAIRQQTTEDTGGNAEGHTEQNREENAEKNAEQIADEGANQESAERNAEESTERNAEESAEKNAKETAKRNVEETAEHNAEETAERNAEKTAEQNAEETAERNAEETVERNAEGAAEQNAEGAAEQNAEETAERNAEETAEQNAEETAEQNAEETAEQNAEETAEQNAEETAERYTEENGRTNTGRSGGQTAEQNTATQQGISAIFEHSYSLLDLIAADVLDPNSRPGRPTVLTLNDKKHLLKTVKRSFSTRRMRVVDLRREASLSHVSDSTILRALHELGLKAYCEEFKFILTAENKAQRMVSTIILNY